MHNQVCSYTVVISCVAKADLKPHCHIQLVLRSWKADRRLATEG